MDEPTDTEIEAGLRLARPEHWDALSAALEEVAAETVHARWEGGKVVATTVVDGVERPVAQMPYVVYTDAVSRLHAALGAIGAIVPFDWMHWSGVEAYRGGRGMADAPVADAVRLVTAVIRSERFCEGSIEGALADGTLLAAAERLRRWRADGR